MNSAAKIQRTANSEQRTANSEQQPSALKILLVTQKPYNLPPLDDGIFFPIQTGKAIHDTDLGIQGDNELNGQPCDNISSKNDYYAEFTAEYWAWKNLKKLYPDVKYIGMCHYRRYFSLHEDKAFCESIPKPESFIQTFRYNPQEIIDILESGKMIVTKPLLFSCSVQFQYCASHISDYYRVLKKVIKDNYPDYYDTFEDVMEFGTKLSARCIFIMKWEDFEEWCEFIFPVMSILEEKIPWQNHIGTSQARVLAVLAERLFYVWQIKNKKKRKFCAIYMPDEAIYSKRGREGLLTFLYRLCVYMQKSLAMGILFIPWRIKMFLRRKKLL